MWWGGVSVGYSEIRSGDEDREGVGKFEMEELVLTWNYPGTYQNGVSESLGWVRWFLVLSSTCWTLKVMKSG